MVVHLVFDLDEDTALQPTFIQNLDEVLKTHFMLDEDEKFTVKIKISENTQIIIVERKSDKFKREQQHIFFTPADNKEEKCHIFSKPWAEATWERTDRHLSPDEAGVGVGTNYSIYAIDDPDTGSKKVIHTSVDGGTLKPNK